MAQSPEEAAKAAAEAAKAASLAINPVPATSDEAVAASLLSVKPPESGPLTFEINKKDDPPEQKPPAGKPSITTNENNPPGVDVPSGTPKTPPKAVVDDPDGNKDDIELKGKPEDPKLVDVEAVPGGMGPTWLDALLLAVRSLVVLADNLAGKAGDDMRAAREKKYEEDLKQIEKRKAEAEERGIKLTAEQLQSASTELNGLAEKHPDYADKIADANKIVEAEQPLAQNTETAAPSGTAPEVPNASEPTATPPLAPAPAAPAPHSPAPVSGPAAIPAALAPTVTPPVAPAPVLAPVAPAPTATPPVVPVPAAPIATPATVVAPATAASSPAPTIESLQRVQTALAAQQTSGPNPRPGAPTQPAIVPANTLAADQAAQARATAAAAEQARRAAAAAQPPASPTQPPVSPRATR